MTRVLVVEDEESYSDALAYMLRKEGYEVAIAADGNTALTEFDRFGPDIVLLDLMLPGVPGTEVCRQIRQTSSVPVIMVSAKDDEVDKVVGLELGADDYVTKPFSLRELTARIRAIFRRADQAAAAAVASPDGPMAVHVGRVEVDLAGHRLLRDGESVPVKPKAFELLSFLIRHQGQVFTRDQLLERVWGYDYTGESRTVDVHVHWLRGEVEEDPATPVHLQTVRGVGYVLRKA